nr:unnamed protein product [Spirometra erinaceieuropaei]
MKLTIEPRHGKSFPVQVEADAIVKHLKGEIEKVRAISGEEQFLTFRRLLLEDGIALREYGITDNAIVTLNVRLGYKPDIVPVRILLPEGGSFVVVARASQTVRSFKDQLCETGQVTAPFDLSCNGFFLEDDHRLAEYRMQTGSNFSVLNRLPRKDSSVPPPVQAPPPTSSSSSSPSSSSEEGAMTVFFKPWHGDAVKVKLGKKDDLSSLPQLAVARQRSLERRRVQKPSQIAQSKDQKVRKEKRQVSVVVSTRRGK